MQANNILLHKDKFKKNNSIKRNINNKKIIIFLALFTYIITFSHILRNLTNIYFLFWALSLVSSVIIFFSSFTSSKRRNIFITVLITLYIYCALLSFLVANQFGSPLVGIGRLVFVLPMIIALVYSINEKTFRKFVIAWMIFGIIAAASLPLQYIFGPISWFSEASERAGIERYGSFAGSLTTFGNIVGVALFAILMIVKKPLYLAILITVIIVGCLASLQKAAFPSIFIALLLATFAGRLKFSAVLGLLAVTIIISFTVYFIADYQLRNTLLLIFETFIGIADVQYTSDVTIIQSVKDRLFELPIIAFEFYGASAAYVGIGVFAGSGGLGFPHLPHTHNLIGEIILLFGLIPATIILLYFSYHLVISILIIINFKRKYKFNDKLAAGLYINITIPFIFAGALLYHPAGAAIFWASLIYLQFYTRIKTNK